MSRTSSSEARQEVARIVEDGAVGTEAIARPMQAAAGALRNGVVEIAQQTGS